MTVTVTLFASILVGPPAQAAGPAHPSTTATVLASYDCEVTPAPGAGAVNVRSGPSTSYNVTYVLYPGDFVESACYGQNGGYYSACGGGTSWVWVHLGLNWVGYVARRCVTLYQWPS